MAKHLTSLLIVAAFVLRAHAGAQDPEWEIELLPGHASWLVANPSGMNSRGWVSGYAGPTDMALRPVLWRDGGYVDLLAEFPGAEGYAFGQATTLNEKGWVGGVVHGPGVPAVAVLWDGNRGEAHIVHPGTIPGYTFTHSQIMDLNERCQAAGMVRNFTGGPYKGERAYAWDSYGKSGTLLPIPAGYVSSQAFSLNNEGVIGGHAWDGFFDLEACAWLPRGGGQYELVHIQPLLAEEDPAIVRSFVTHVDGHGRVYGVGQAAGFVSNWTFVWEEGEGVRFLDTDASIGQVWGGSRKVLAGYRGNLFAGGVVALAWIREVPHVLPQLPGLASHVGATANARGDVAGYAMLPGKLLWFQGSEAWVARRVGAGSGD